MKIQVLGPGCPKCNEVAKNAIEAAQAVGLDYEIEKVTDFNDIIKFGVMMTPGLAIDGEVKCVGKVPTVDEIKAMLA
ncbi:thioredoxin family protein [Desulfopila sp. IMCC35008]|uniref:thioredoxin family protein n=1 Tax=Desulfopila sp. IMCC35008 TaxID=2653858 RepID=UPI0013D5C16B|nr:thioredoxin family protein [Desulfopila sp. IMCC35008]